MNQTEALGAKIEKLTQLLSRAKGTINQYKARTEELETEVEVVSNEKRVLENKHASLSGLEPPANSEIDSVLAMVRVQKTLFACVYAKTRVTWVDSKDYAFTCKLPDVIDQSCTVKSQEETLNGITKQYEDRVKCIQEALNTTEKNKRTLQS